jgi:hypothetical protein
MRATRTAGLAGLATVALAGIEFFGPSFPATDDSPAVIERSFADHSTWTLFAAVVQGVSAGVLVVFLCGLALHLYRAGSLAAAAVSLAAGLLNVAISLTGLAAIATLGFSAADLASPTVDGALFTYASMTLVLSNAMLAVMAFGVASAALPAWLRWISAAVGLVFAVGSAAFAHQGAFSPDGGVQFATYALELLWTVLVSVVLLRAPRPAGGSSPSAAAAPAAVGVTV